MTPPKPTTVHIWHRCHHCGAAPVKGGCYRCLSCPAGPDNDLCESCHGRLLAGEIEHPAESRRVLTTVDGPHEFRRFEGRPLGDFDSWLTVPESPLAAPPVVDRFVLRPEFRSGRATAFGSFGFVAAPPAGARAPLFVTALHVLDELIKGEGVDASVANDEYSGRELPAVVTGVVLYDVFAANWMLAECATAGPMLILPDARVDEEEPYSDRDIAAFWLGDAANLRPCRLAAAAPAVGDPVWLAAPAPGDPATRSFAAVVVESTPRTLVFRYADHAVPDYTSGAPLLDSAGEIAGIKVGGGVLHGRRFGHAHVVTSLRRHLSRGIALDS